jgi:DNA-directed RNA polymerase specialized sigma24 family protein
MSDEDKVVKVKRTRRKNRNKSKDYIDNEKFFGEMSEFIAGIKLAEKNGEEKPIPNDYIGKCLFDLATHLSFNQSFINYSYKEDMISDAVENCLTYIHNYDPEKSNNPFAYFTTISWYAFIRRINKEKRQTYLKYKSAENMGLTSGLSHTQENDDETYNESSYVDYLNQSNNIIESYENSMNEKTKKRKKGLEKFMPEEEKEEGKDE